MIKNIKHALYLATTVAILGSLYVYGGPRCCGEKTRVRQTAVIKKRRRPAIYNRSYYSYPYGDWYSWPYYGIYNPYDYYGPYYYGPYGGRGYYRPSIGFGINIGL